MYGISRVPLSKLETLTDIGSSTASRVLVKLCMSTKRVQLTELTSVQVKPASHSVGPVQPMPPHCPYWATVPAAEVPDAAGALVDTTGDEAEVTGPDAAGAEEAGAAVAAPGGAVVGTVAG